MLTWICVPSASFSRFSFIFFQFRLHSNYHRFTQVSPICKFYFFQLSSNIFKQLKIIQQLIQPFTKKTIFTQFVNFLFSTIIQNKRIKNRNNKNSDFHEKPIIKHSHHPFRTTPRKNHHSLNPATMREFVVSFGFKASESDIPSSRNRLHNKGRELSPSLVIGSRVPLSILHDSLSRFAATMAWVLF